jgi:hypothetical protein
MAQDEGDVLVAAGVSQPVPAMDTLAADDQPLLEGFDGPEEGLGLCGQVAAEAGLALVVEDAEEQGPGMQIDAGLESGVGWGVEVAHEGLQVRVLRQEAAGCHLHLRNREPS